MGLNSAICKVIGHKFKYNFTWMPSKCYCERCGKRWKSIKNPNYKGNIVEEDIFMWVEDKEEISNIKFKLLVIGPMRHGKDTFAEILNKHFGLKFQSSSQAAADIFIYDTLKPKYGYKTSEECFEDRVNHRAEWYELICMYNHLDKAKLAKSILKTSDCYVGMRDRDEIKECLRQKVFDLVIWVDADKRMPPEPTESFNIDKSCADIIIENNGTLAEFEEKVIRFGKLIFKK